MIGRGERLPERPLWLADVWPRAGIGRPAPSLPTSTIRAVIFRKGSVSPCRRTCRHRHTRCGGRLAMSNAVHANGCRSLLPSLHHPAYPSPTPY